jgi:GDSL-like lipase/acylhydrolase family protein
MSASKITGSGVIPRRAFLGAAAAAGTASLIGAPALLALDGLNPVRPRGVASRSSFRMAVLGDSIMWGQGLRTEEKYWFTTKSWLAHELGRPVEHQLFAHSGARIEPYSYLDAQPALGGEIPSPSPSVVKQAQLVQNPSEIDLVLLDGGANDVGLSNAMSPEATPPWIAEKMRTKCGERMKAMLCYLAGLFPNARFAVTGYYPLVSLQSFAGVDAIVALIGRVYGLDPVAATLYTNQRDVLLSKSYAFANESAKWLRWAVDETNALFPNRAVFAKPAIDGDRCFAASDSHIWGLEPDPVRAQRIAECNATGRSTFFDFETMDLGRNYDPVCPLASIMHPNAKGAQRYFEALTAELPELLPFWRA